MIEELGLIYDSEDLAQEAQALAQQLNLPINSGSAQQLVLTKERLQLQLKGMLPLFVDFNSKTWQKRRDAGKQQGIVRACKPTPGLRVIDATGGWGRDAAVLASFGAEVLILERHPIMAALLADAISRQDEHSQRVLKLKLLWIDALTYLQNLEEKDYPDLIYIDPMHPERQKSALVKKDLQVLQQLIGPDADAIALIELARQRALKRIVVKWPQSQPALLPPDLTIPGKTVRFDLYYPK